MAPHVAEALSRAESVFRRRPGAGLHDDSPASAKWEGGLRLAAGHPNGTRIASDMPQELGGGGELITPGWLMRAGLASCTGTVIAMRAARLGVDLKGLELEVRSRSDTRGLLGMQDDGHTVTAAPTEMQLLVRIAARGTSAGELRTLVEESYHCSPVACVIAGAMPVALQIEVEEL